MRLDAEVLIVGGGPAGAAAGLSLARAGRAVTIVDKYPHPRDKVCGDGLVPDAIQELQELGCWDTIEATGHACQSVEVTGPNGRAINLEASTLTLRRRVLDAVLLERARQAGVQVRDGLEAMAFTAGPTAAEVSLRGEEGEVVLRSAMVLLCCGASAKTLERFGVPHRRKASAIAGRTYLRLRPGIPTDRLFIFFEQSLLPGYAWAFPMGDRIFNVGVGSFLDMGSPGLNLRALFQRFAEISPRGSELLAESEQLEPLKGAPLRTGLVGTAPSQARLLVAGEGIGSTYSLTGEGIGKALATGRLAAQIADRALAEGCVDAARLRVYDQALKERFSSHFRTYRQAQAWLRWPVVANFLTWKASRSPRLRTLLAEAIAEQRPFTEVLSPQGLIRAMVFP